MNNSISIIKQDEEIEHKFLNFQSPELREAFVRVQNVMASSKTAYKKGISYFCLWLNEKGIDQPKEIHIHDYLDYLLTEKKLKSTTVNSYLIAVKRFFVFIEPYGYPNVAKDVKTLEVPREYLRDPLTDKQVRSLVDSIDRSTNIGLRDYAMISLMARNGLRSHSVIHADIKDIAERGDIKILRYLNKGHQIKDEWTQLKDEVLKALAGYLRTRLDAKPDEPLFVSYSDRNKGLRLTTATIRKMIKDRLKEIGINDDRLSCHSLRHFFGSKAAEKGCSPIQLMMSMGHRNVTTSMKYTRDWGRQENGAENFVSF